MKNLILFFSLITFSFVDMYSQDIFVIKANENIYQLLPDGSLEYIVTVDELDSKGLTDIAISPSNKLYGVIPLVGIIEIDWETGEYVPINTNHSISTNSLVCASENELFYMANSSLYKYNLNSDSIILISEVGYNTPGDVCILKRNIIFPTLYDVKVYNIDTETLSTVYCFAETQVHWGISSMYADCDSSIIILSNPTTVYEPDFIKIDLSTGVSTPIDGNPISSSKMLGMATNEEFTGMDCESFEFTDVDCSEIVSTTGSYYEENEITIYPNPVNQFFSVKGCNSFCKVEIYNSNGVLLEKSQEVSNEVDISKLNNGIYFLAVECDDIMSFHKVIKL